MLTRRSLLASLFAVPLAKLWPRKQPILRKGDRIALRIVGRTHNYFADPLGRCVFAIPVSYTSGLDWGYPISESQYDEFVVQFKA